MLADGINGDHIVHTILVDDDGRQYVILDDGAGNTLPAGDDPARPIYVKLTDGTEYASIDVNNQLNVNVRRVYPDGVNQLPSGDDPARCIFIKLSDGTEIATITAEGYLDVKTHTPENCFHEDYAGAQAAVVILTPTAGKKIRVISTYASTETVATDVTLAFGTSGNIFFKLYTSQRAAQTGNTICALGAADETIKLTCGAGTFVSIGYDEVD